jgi:hypothetical protein
VEHEQRNGHTPLNGYPAEDWNSSLSDHTPANGHATPNGQAKLSDPAAAIGRASGNGHPAIVAPVDVVAPRPANGVATRQAPATKPQLMQQLHEARRRQGLSVRCVAQRLNLSVGEVRAQEDVHADMLLSDLYRWQSVLEVPLEELLADPQDGLSPRVLMRARMLRVMKTARALRAQARSESEHRLAKLLISQLIEIMPELKEVSAWPTVGHRRTADEMGRIAENPIPDDFMHEAS